MDFPLCSLTFFLKGSTFPKKWAWWKKRIMDVCTCVSPFLPSSFPFLSPPAPPPPSAYFLKWAGIQKAPPLLPSPSLPPSSHRRINGRRMRESDVRKFKKKKNLKKLRGRRRLLQRARLSSPSCSSSPSFEGGGISKERRPIGWEE